MLAHLGQFFGGAVAPISHIVLKEFLYVPLIYLCSLGLTIRAVLPCSPWPLIPRHPEPTQILGDSGLGSGVMPFDVGVLNPENEDTIVLQREEFVIEGGSGVPDMQ
jgi:hypothetical protein